MAAFFMPTTRHARARRGVDFLARTPERSDRPRPWRCEALLLRDVLHQRDDAEHEQDEDEQSGDRDVQRQTEHLHGLFLSTGAWLDSTTARRSRERLGGMEGGGMSKREGTGRAYRKLVARQRSLGLPCWICGKAIRYDLPGGHPLSYEYDHFHPVSRWSEFGYASKRACIHDPANGRSAHRICNERRQGAMPWEKGWRRVGAITKSPPATPSKRSRAE